MEINKRNRKELKSYFVKNAIPTQSNFSEFIDAMLNQKEDGIVKLPGDPLSIEAAGDDTSQKKAINFYRNFTDEKPSWTLSLNPRTDPAKPETGRLGFSINDGEGNSRLFIDRSTGNVGIGTTSPEEKLHLYSGSGNVQQLIEAGGANEAQLDLKSGTTQTRLFYRDRDDEFGIYHKGTTRFRIQSDGTILINQTGGKVGIGTTNPQMKLEVNGNVKFNFGDTGSFVFEKMDGLQHIGTTYVLRPHKNLHGSLGHPNYFVRNAYIHDLWYNFYKGKSDARIKTNMQPIRSPLEKLMKLQGYVYDIKDDAFDGPVEARKDNIGFVAQEVKEIYPQLVHYNPESDSYYLEYDGFIPIVVEAIKEFKRQYKKKYKELENLIERQQSEIECLKQ